MAQPVMTANLRTIPLERPSATWAVLAARLCFAAVIVITPVPARILLLARPFPALSPDITSLFLFPSDVAILFTLACWSFALMVTRRSINLGPSLIWIPLAGLTVMGGASAFFGLDPVLAGYHAIRLAVLFWFYLFIVNEIRSPAWVLIPVGLQVLSQSLVALAQFVTQHSVGLQWLGEQDLDPTRNGVSIVASGSMRLLRAYGLSDHPNILGGCLAFGLILLLFAYLRTRFRWIAFLGILAAGAALIATFSRSAWLACAAGSLFILGMDLMRKDHTVMRRWLWLAPAVVAVVLPFALAYPAFFGARLGAGNSFSTPSVEQQSIGERVLLIQAAESIIASRPVLGVGLGAAPLALKIYRPDWPVAFEPPHMALLEAAVETGIVGAGFYLALLVAPWAMCLSQRVSLTANAVTTTLLALLLAITVVGFFDYYTWTGPAGRVWQWLAWGLWAAMTVPQHSSELFANVHSVT